MFLPFAELFLEKLFSAHATVAIVRATTFDEKLVRASNVQPESLLQRTRVGTKLDYESNSPLENDHTRRYRKVALADWEEERINLTEISPGKTHRRP